MLGWITRLFAFLMASSLAHASEEDYSDLPGVPRDIFKVSSNFSERVWPTNFEDIFGAAQPTDFESMLKDDPTKPSINNAPKEPAQEVELAQPSGLSKNEEFEVLKVISAKKRNNPYFFKLLSTLKQDGPSHYDSLRSKVTAEGRKIYSLCATCRERGWISTPEVGVWKLTTKGEYALRLLKEKGFKEGSESTKRPRNNEDDDEVHIFDDEDDEESLPKIAKTSIKSQADPSMWPKEFRRFLNPERYLSVLEVLEDGGKYSSQYIRGKVKNSEQFETAQITRLLKILQHHLWVAYHEDFLEYSITQEGIDMLRTIEKYRFRKQKNSFQDEASPPQTAPVLPKIRIVLGKKPHITTPHEPEAMPADPVIEKRMLPRTRSMNDLGEEENKGQMDLPRAAELMKKRRVDEGQQPVVENVAPQFCWEQLTDKIRLYLLEQLDTNIIAVILADKTLMKEMMAGNLLQNLCREIGQWFLRQYGIRIDHWIEAYLEDRLKISI